MVVAHVHVHVSVADSNSYSFFSPPLISAGALYSCLSVIFLLCTTWPCIWVHLRWHSGQLNVSTKTTYLQSNSWGSPSPPSPPENENMCSWFCLQVAFCIFSFSQPIGCALSYDVSSSTHPPWKWYIPRKCQKKKNIIYIFYGRVSWLLSMPVRRAHS